MLDYSSSQFRARLSHNEKVKPDFASQNGECSVLEKSSNSSPTSSSSDDCAPPHKKTKGGMSEDINNDTATYDVDNQHGDADGRSGRGEQAAATASEGPVAASVNEDGEDQEDTRHEMAESEEALIGQSTDKLAPKARIPRIRKGEDEQTKPEPTYYSGDADASQPWKGRLMGPMEPMELSNGNSNNSSYRRSIDRSKLSDSPPNGLPPMPGFPVGDPGLESPQPSRKSSEQANQKLGHNAGSANALKKINSIFIGDSANNSNHTGANARKPKRGSDTQRIPSLSEDIRLANAVAEDYQNSNKDPGNNNNKANGAGRSSRSDKSVDFPNLLADMYAQDVNSPALPFMNPSSNHRNARFPSRMPPPSTVDGFAEAAQAPRHQTAPHFSAGTPGFRYTYPGNILPGTTLPMHADPSVYHSPAPHDTAVDGDPHNPHHHHHHPQQQQQQQQQQQHQHQHQQQPQNGQMNIPMTYPLPHPPLTTTAYPVLFSTAPVGQVPMPHHSLQVPAFSTPPTMPSSREGTPQQPQTHHNLAPPPQTEERVYKCTHPGCEWSFARSSDFKRHVRSHLKPSLRCPYWELESTCNRKGGMFYRLDVLKRHLRLVHLNRPTDGSSDGGQCRVCMKDFSSTREFIDHCETCAKDAQQNHPSQTATN